MAQRIAKMPRTACSLVMLLGACLGACSSSSEEVSGGDGVYTLDLTHYDPGQSPSSLSIANDTLLLPLHPGARYESLSRTEPGDLRVLYTRVGCWISDPGKSIDPEGRLPAQNPVRLASIAIDQELRPSSSSTLDSLAQQTCFTYRTTDGGWQALRAPTNVVEASDSVRAELVLPGVEVDAIAIFLPTWTNVRQVSYSVRTGAF